MPPSILGQVLQGLQAYPRIQAVSARLADVSSFTRDIIGEASTIAVSAGAQFYQDHLAYRPHVDRWAQAVYRGGHQIRHVLRPWQRTLEIIDSTLEHAPQPVGVMKCYPDGTAKLILFNAVNRNLSGLRKEEVKGTDVSRFFEADDLPRVREYIQRCLRDGRATEQGMRMKRRSGGHILVDMNAWLIKKPDIAAFQVINETDREAAKGLNRIFEEVTRHSSGAKAIVHFDHEGSPVIMLTSSTLTERLGYEADALNGIPFQRLFPRSLHSALDTRLRRLEETGQFNWQAVRLLSRDGHECLCDIEANASLVEGGRYAEVFFSDAEARIHAERDAAAAREKDIMAATSGQVGHDLNNGLSVIFNLFGAFQIERPDDPLIPEALKRVEMMVQSARRLRNLSDSSRPVAGYDIHDILSSERGITMDIKGSDEVRITLRKTADAWLIAVSPDIAYQIYLNFVTNAIEAMAASAHKELTITTENVHLATRAEIRHLDTEDLYYTAVPGDYLKLSIQDTGSGITPDVLPRIFEDKFSTKPGMSVNRGRGLSSTRREIIKVGGLITVETELNRGTRFDIYFPRFDVAHSTDRVAASSAANYVSDALKSPGNETLLVADDDEHVLSSTVRVMQRYGYNTVQAKSTDEIIEAVRSHSHLSAIIMDWRMPGMTGEDLVKELMRIDPALPIFVFTGLIPERTNLHHPKLAFHEKNKPLDLVQQLRDVLDGDRRQTVIPKSS